MYDENLVHSGSKGDQQKLEKLNSAFIFDFYVKILICYWLFRRNYLLCLSPRISAQKLLRAHHYQLNERVSGHPFPASGSRCQR